MVSKRTGARICCAVLLGRTFDSKRQTAAAKVFDSLQALPDFIFHPSTQCRPGWSGLSLWLPASPPQTKCQAKKPWILPQWCRQNKEEIFEWTPQPTTEWISIHRKPLWWPRRSCGSRDWATFADGHQLHWSLSCGFATDSWASHWDFETTQHRNWRQTVLWYRLWSKNTSLRNDNGRSSRD